MFGLTLLKTCATVAVIAAATWAGAGSASTITSTSVLLTTSDVGTSWTVDYTCTYDPACAGASAQANFTLTTVATTATQVKWGFNVVFSNTSTSSAGGFLTSTGFNTGPNATMSGFTNYSGGGDLATNWHGGAGSVPGMSTELCIWDGSNCSASNTHTMTPGNTDKVSFTLTTGLQTSLTMDNFAVKEAGVGPCDGTSYEFGGKVRVPAPVPLPAGGLMLVGGLGALGAARRRRKAA